MSTSAVLNGTGTPNGEQAFGWFRYATTSPGTCNDTFGTRVPAASGTDLGSGAVAVSYSITTMGLVAGTTYYFCAIVNNATGKAYGSVMSFTIPSTPVVVTNAATTVTAGSATLQGSGNPVAANTTGWFRYSSTDPGTCNDTFGTRTPSSGGSSLGSGITPVPYNYGISGLSPGVTYYFCAIASNSYGTGVGTVKSFTTPAMAPQVSTYSASNLTRTTGTLNGYANPGGDATTGWFRYNTASPGTCNDTFGTRAPATGGTALGAGSSSVSFAQNITGLAPGITYYYCAIAANGMGTSWGAVQTFITPSSPTATTTAATYVTNTSAQLNGSGNPNRATANGWFRYALTNPMTCDDKFGSRAPVTGSTYLGEDVFDQSYSQSISGLSPATTYYYCAIVASSEGTAFGTIQTFTTSTAATATTAAATSVTSSTATLNGAGNPMGANATGWFRYATTNPGSCSDGFGTRAPYSSGSGLGAGTAGVPFSQGISSLSPSTTYYYCAIVNNSYGYGYGSVMSFTTPAMAATVTTYNATNLTKTTGTLVGYGYPGGDATTGWFRYSTTSPGTCNDTFGTRAPAMGGSALGSGSGSVSFQQNITGLTAGTTYYYCALASNTLGMVFGSVQTFVTPAAPTALTTAATYVTTSSAQLNGSGNPNRAATNGWFRYSSTAPMACNDTFGSRAPVMGNTYLGADPSDTPFSQSISGLSSGTTYYYCAIVQSPEGTAFGAVLSFVTSGSPTATTAAATTVTSSSATLNGSGNPNLANATGWFRYATTNPGSCSDGFGTRAPYSGGSGLGAGSASVSFSQSISSLSPGVTYYYCAIVSNTYGTGFGSVMSFTTPATAPQVTTYNATNLTRTTGTLVAYGTPGGDATTGWFRYSTASPGTCNDTFGTRAPAMGGSALGSGTSSVYFQQNITGLTPNTTYYYCALASNSMGMVLGSVQTFITPAAPTATTTVATYVTTSSAQLNGSGNPNRAAANGWFRYSTTDPGTCDDKFGSRAPVMGTTYLGADPSDTPFSQSISGLSSGTTYYYCAIVQSSEGVAFGAVLSFVTSGIPTATTAAATTVTSGSATLNGSGNPNLANATGWFRYSTTNPGTCSDGFGTRAPYSSGSGLGAGSASVSYSQSISSLSPGVTYYYCAIVSNSYGTGYGSVMSFTTPATGPQITTYNATNLTRTTGTLVGYGNPGGDATTGWFRYATSSPGTCNDTFGTRAPAMGGSALGSGASSVSFQQNITGLTPGVIYYYCAIGKNSVGTAWGAVQTFITPSAPTAVTTPASYITNTTAQLNGSGNPNRGATTGWFRYALTAPMACDDTFGSRAPLMSGQYLGSEPGDVPYSASVSGLSPATTYYYCAIVSSSEGTAFGAIQTFVTSGAASATTAAATTVTSSSATLNGSGNPAGANATGWFRYAATDPGSCSDAFGTRAPYSSGSGLGGGMTGVSYSQSISGLLPGVTYYYCAIVSNTYGTGFGSVLSFTTPVMAPTVSTNSATNLTKTTGTLTGYANPGGDATTGWFRYSAASPGTCNDTFGTRAPAMGGTALGSGSSSVTFQQNITGLTAATTYYFCAIASNSQGTAWGAVQSFTTPTAPTALTTPATYITNTTAQLNGSGNPNRGSTTGWFRYALTNPMTCDDKFGSRAPVTGGQYLGTDITDQPYSVAINGLSSGTTYYYCAIVSSSEGTAFGTIQTFTTSGAATATSAAATSVTATTATLNGSGNPNGATATGWFRFSSTNPGTCNDTFGTRAPYSSGTGLGTGMTSVQFGQPITGLAPGVTYYYCAIASNTYGTGFGSVLSFTTPASPPTVTTDYTSGIAITLNGSANPNGAATTGWFRIATTSPGTCNDTFGTRLPTMMGTSLGSGASFVSFSNATTGLTPGTTYYYCAIASNVLGTSFGVVRSFTAPMPPTVSTLAATPVTSTTATLNGSSNPNGNSTIGWFRYSTSSPGACNDVFGTRAPVASGTALGAGTAATPFGEAITGLAPATTYYFCAIASSAYGTVLGSVLSFTTPPSSSATDPTKPGSETGTAADSVLTEDATLVDAASAKLHGSTNPRGRTSTGWFRYDTTKPDACDDKFGTRAPDAEGVQLEAVSKSVAFAQELTGLGAGSKYYYCAIASLDGKTVFGKVLSFTTKAAAPSLTTALPTEVTADSAVLNGSVLPNGEVTNAWFRYSAQKPESCTDSFGERAPISEGQDVGAGIKKLTYSVALSGLTKGTTYYYCAIATNAKGTTYGEIVSFVPGTEPPAASTETPPVLDPTSTETPPVVDPNGIATTASTASTTNTANIGVRSLAVTPAPEAAAPAPAVAHPAKDAAADGAGLGGCSYSASVGGAGSSPLLPLASVLPLAGLLLLRRRRQLKAA